MVTEPSQLEQQIELAKRYKPFLVLYPEINAATRDDARNKGWRESGKPPLTEDYHPRDVRFVLDHAWIRRRSQHNRELLIDQMDRSRSAERIKYHQGVLKPDQAWRDYRDIVNKQGAHQGEDYGHCAYAHFVYGDQGSRYAGLTAIQYWFFYYYNDWKASHAGDWEHIVVILKDAPAGQGPEPEPYACAYSAHHGGYRLGWKNVERVDDEGNIVSGDGSGEGTHPVVYVANGSHANYFFGPSRYVTTTEVLGQRVTSEQMPFSGGFIDFTESFERGIRVFPEVEVVPSPVNGAWEEEWRWLNFHGKWGSNGTPQWRYFWELLRGRRAIGDAPGSLTVRENWTNPFVWVDNDCIDPLPPMDNWLTNEYYLRL
jgi:hypothetical protein